MLPAHSTIPIIEQLQSRGYCGYRGYVLLHELVQMKIKNSWLHLGTDKL